MINYAHRGASAYAPENTLAAFYLGLEMGANGIETDVRKTADGVPVLFHDESTLRLTGKDQKIVDMTYAQLYAEDVGSYKHEKYKNEKVVTIHDFLRYFGAKDIEIAIEIKAPFLEEDVYRAVLAYGCKERVVITSYHLDFLKKIRAMDADIRLGLLDKIGPEGIVDRAEAAGIRQYCPSIDLVTQEMMADVHGRGMTLRTCCVKDVDRMKKAIELGVDGMTINFPDILAQALKERG